MLLPVEGQLHPPVFAVVKNSKHLDLAGVALKTELATVKDAKDGFRP